MKKWIYVLIIVSGYVRSTNTSPCQSPDIPDSYFNPNYSNTAAAPSGTYVFTIPAPHNCSGTVRFVQYCYHKTKRSMMKNIFTLCPKQLRMSNCINIRRRPQDNIMCNQRICCQKSQIREFQISTSNYTFNVTTRPDQPLLLAFPDPVMKYWKVESYASTRTQPLSNGSLLLLRFFIGMHE